MVFPINAWTLVHEAEIHDSHRVSQVVVVQYSHRKLG